MYNTGRTHLAGFTKSHLLDLFVSNQLNFNNGGDLVSYSLEENLSDEFEISRSGVTLLTLDSSGNLVLTGTLTATAIVSGRLEDADDTTSVAVEDFNEVVSFRTNSLERMRIDSSGNVGIGMTPVELLDITGTNGDIINFTGASSDRLHLQISNTDNQIEFGIAGAVGDFFTGISDGDAVLRSNDMSFHLGTGSSNAPTLTIDTSQNIGVGVISPTEKLDVVGDINASVAFNIAHTEVLSSTTLGSLVVGSSLTSVGTLTSLTMGGDIAMGTNDITGATNLEAINAKIGASGDEFVIGGAAATWASLAHTDYNGFVDYALVQNTGTGQVILNTATGTTGNVRAGNGSVFNWDSNSIDFLQNVTMTRDLTVDTNTLKVDSTNNRVGINSATPTVALDVVGDVVISADLTVDTNTLKVDSTNNRVGINTASPSVDLELDGNSAFCGTGGTWSFDSAGLRRTGFYKQVGGSTIILASSQLALEFGHGDTTSFDTITSATTQMVIKPNGDVGINDETPTFKLDVNGTFRATGNAQFDSNVGIGAAATSIPLEINTTNPQILIQSGSGGGGEIFFGNVSHGVGRDTGITNFTDGNDVLLHTIGSGDVGMQSAGGFVKLDAGGFFQLGDGRLDLVDSDTRIQGDGGAIMDFYVSGGLKTRMHGSGNISIGSTSDFADLYIQQASDVVIRADAFDAVSFSSLQLLVDANTTAQGLQIATAGTAGDFCLQAGHADGVFRVPAANDMYFLNGTTNAQLRLVNNNQIHTWYDGANNTDAFEFKKSSNNSSVEFYTTFRRGCSDIDQAGTTDGRIETVATFIVLTNISDARLKENIRNYTDGLSVIENIKTRRFDWIDGEKDIVGFVAQELNEVCPSAVSYDEIEDLYAVAPSNLIPHLVSAVKELSERVKELESKLI